MNKWIRPVITALTLLAFVAVVTSGETDAAHAKRTSATSASSPTYHVGGTIAVKVGHLPKSSRKYAREAVDLLNRYTTSRVVKVKWCKHVESDWCIAIRPTRSLESTAGGVAATHWKLRTRIHTDGHSETAWMGRVIYVQRWALDASRASQRGLFAHELGHAFTLQHHQRVKCGTYKGYDSAADVMGNNGQGSKKYFRISWRTYNEQCQEAPSNRDILRTI